MGDQRISGQVLAYLLDLDGTVYDSKGPIPGALDTLERLSDRGVPFCFVTNTTRKPRSSVIERLRGYGIETDPGRIVTAVSAGVAKLRAMGAVVVAPFVARDTLEDLKDFELSGGTSGSSSGRTDAVLLGDLGSDWSVELLNEAFRYVMDGASLVALQKNRYWQAEDGLAMDAGPFVAALEYAADSRAVVCGKPNREFFEAAIATLDIEADPAAIAMVGDDLWGDVRGAQQAGLQGWLVRTGKFREDTLDGSVTPDRVLDSIAAIPV